MLMSLSTPKGGQNTQKKEIVLFGGIGESFILDRVFKLGLAKEVGFKHTGMK